MSQPVIHVERLGKRYRIPTARRRTGGMFRRLCWPFRGAHDLWALRDVTFAVRPGEVVGIIGRNGAGKSTLLKILSGITYPTTGRAWLRGRVASLLEVGTGFHPDLTARENVFLNGALLGMSRGEIRRKFDEIVAFAEVEAFLDTSIKHFSTGMQMRLAFAVAAHLDGEILIIDEALSVGDAAFQEKCIDAMSTARGGGRTVLLVSHNVAVLRGIADRAILLENGRLTADGGMEDVLRRYMTTQSDQAVVDLRDFPNREGAGTARIDAVEIRDARGMLTNRISVGSRVEVRMRVRFHEPLDRPQFGVIIYSSDGEALVNLEARHDGVTIDRADGLVDVRVRVDGLCLYPGRYLLGPWVADRAMSRELDHTPFCATLVVEPGDPTGRGIPLDPRFGRFFVGSRWSVRAADDGVSSGSPELVATTA
jgi:lipopolysaccharide transport system ATP-binding protein